MSSPAVQYSQEQWAQWQRRQSLLDQLNRQFVQPVLHFVKFLQCSTVKPQYQFMLALLLSWKFPQLFQRIQSDIPGSRFGTVFKLVVIAQLSRLSYALWEFMQYMKYNMGQCALTSQVCATRATMLEWRSLLHTAAQWHRCSLQGAYQLWQSNRIGVPAPPANQWKKLTSGQPLTLMDQCIGQATVPVAFQELLQWDSVLAVAQEKIHLAGAKVRPLTASEAAQVDNAKQLIEEFQSQCKNSNLFDFSQHSQDILQFMSQFKDKFDQPLDCLLYTSPSPRD